MAVYYRYKSERFFDSIAINVPFISVSYFKQRIFESKRYGWGNDFDLVVINAHTNEEYLDEAMLIHKNSSVLIRRVPGWPRKPMVADHRVTPKSMLMATLDGSYALSSGAVAVLKPKEAAFEKEMEGVPSTCSVGELPPELHCRLCKEVLKDAVLARCCFESFCEKCIRDHIISKTMCVCGKKNILADDLLPNKTLRHTINRILEGGNSSSENAGSTIPVRDMESARCLLLKVPSPTLSAASMGEQKPSPVSEETPRIHETGDEGKAAIFPQRTAKKGTEKAADMSEFTHEPVSVSELTSLGSAPLDEEEVHQKVPTSEAGKKKEKKKARIPANDLEWKSSRDLAAENNMMPSGPSAFNPYWTGMQPGMDGCLAPYPGAMPPYMGYGIRPFDMPFGGIVPPDPFGAQGYMFTPIPPQREFSKDWEFGGVVNRVADVPSIKLKSKHISPLSSAHCHRPAKRKLEHYADRKVSKKMTR